MAAKKKVVEVKPKLKDLIKEVHLEDKADEEYKLYGEAVIEDRAIFGAIDGLKPVMRRAMWAIHKLGLHHKAKHDKSAKAVGETLGNYHPHGDTACYEAIVNAANLPVKLIDGDGNWGTMNDKHAAMRYTNLRLSKYSDLVFFDRFYAPSIQYIPNYDGSRQEPLNLSSLLPNALLNGNFGIAPGVNTRSPSFSIASLIPLLQSAIEQNKCTAAMCMGLKFTTKYGGKAIKTKGNKKQYLEFFKTGRGSVIYKSTAPSYDTNIIRFDHFAPFSDAEKVIAKVDCVKGVVGTRDDSDKTDPFEAAYIVELSKSLKGKDRESSLKQINNAFSATHNYVMKVTHRSLSPQGLAAVKLSPTTVPQLIMDWITYRLKLEVDACTYWIKERAKEIAYIDLLRLAVAKRDIIIKALSKKCSEEELAQFIAKQLKVTVAEANVILDLKVRQLRALEDAKLLEKRKLLVDESKTYEGRKKNPAKYVVSHLDMLAKELT